jgi:hypothetical protein
MSQFDEVSNIANPTFDAELAISMTVNAKLPKTPQSRTAGASDLAVDSLDNKIPIGRARNWVATTCPISRPNGEQRAEFQGAAVRKATATDRCGCSKSGLQRIRTNLVCAGRHLNRICAKQFHALACPAIGLSEPRRHELDKFRERVAVLGAEFRQRFRE